jgi:hypothetical protein
VEVEFALTEDDIIAFQRYARANPLGGSGPQTRFKVYGAIIYGLFLFFFVVEVATAKGAINWQWVAQWAALLGLPPLLFVFGPRCLDWANRKALRKDPRALGRCRIAITPQALETSAALGSGSTLWLGVEKIASTRDYALFYITPTLVHVVPRHAFEDEEDFKKFVDASRLYHDAAKSSQRTGDGTRQLSSSTDIQAPDEPSNQGTVEGIIPKGTAPPP